MLYWAIVFWPETRTMCRSGGTWHRATTTFLPFHHLSICMKVLITELHFSKRWNNKRKSSTIHRNVLLCNCCWYEAWWDIGMLGSWAKLLHPGQSQLVWFFLYFQMTLRDEDTNWQKHGFLSILEWKSMWAFVFWPETRPAVVLEGCGFQEAFPLCNNHLPDKTAFLPSIYLQESLDYWVTFCKKVE